MRQLQKTGGKSKEKKIDKDTDLDVKEQNFDDDAFTDKNSCIDFLNKSLSCIGESPVRKKRIMQDSNYCKRKLEKAKESLLSKFIKKDELQLDIQDSIDSSDSIIITQLKEKFEKQKIGAKNFSS